MFILNHQLLCQGLMQNPLFLYNNIPDRKKQRGRATPQQPGEAAFELEQEK
jgi:hypothetical protein